MLVQWRHYKTYAGCHIGGVYAVPIPAVNLHMDRAFYLTARIEAPLYGAVQSYDGAGMSAGPLHNIAVYPRNKKQGSLFALLRAIEYGSTGSQALENLWAAYEEQGWFVARDGVLRHLKTGKAILGADILRVFTPPYGDVPKTGPLWEQAKKWAVLHHEVFADARTYSAQKEYAIEYLIRTQKSVENGFYKDRSMYTLRVQDIKAPTSISLEEDLAMCVYHSHSVNGPVPAATVLKQALSQSKEGVLFARALLKGLANYQYGNWKARYARTRKEAAQSGLWPMSFFTGEAAVMPA